MVNSYGAETAAFPSAKRFTGTSRFNLRPGHPEPVTPGATKRASLTFSSCISTCKARLPSEMALDLTRVFLITVGGSRLPSLP